jgi:chitinase
MAHMDRNPANLFPLACVRQSVPQSLPRALAVVVASFLLTVAATSQAPIAPPTTVSSGPSLIGYFPQWGIYNQPQYLVKNLAPSGKAPLVDQINYAQGSVANGRCSIADPNADLAYAFSAEQSVDGTPDIPSQTFRGNLHQLQELKRRYPRLRILISLEGRSSNFAEDAQPQNRAAFVASCVDTFLKGNFAPGIVAPGIFDGIDLDWEYPHQADAENYLALLTDLRRQMDDLRPGLLLTIAAGPSPRTYEGVDMAAVARLVDRIGLMTYDFSGPWSDTTGLIAPLTVKPGFDNDTVAHAVEAYLAAGVPASKLLMGLPFYGYGWHQVTETDTGLLQEGLPIRGDHPYSYIAGLVAHSTVYRDPDSQTPWLFDGDIFWTYDDPISIDRKAEYARDHRLGGLMIWELSEDTATADLLHAAFQSLHSPGLPIRQTSPQTPLLVPAASIGHAPLASPTLSSR